MKIYIETLGCPKNEVDSAAAEKLLLQKGHSLADSPAEADAIIVNTCAFIQDAKEESIDTIFEMAQYKEQGDKLLVVTGCLGERYNDDLFKEIPEADLIIGVNDYGNLPRLLEEVKSSGRRKMRSDWARTFDEFEDVSGLVRNGSAYLKIAEGCDNRCTYCIIPHIRGGYRSRTMEAIYAEAETLAKEGAKELVLIAQDVTNYGSDLYGGLKLPELLRKLKSLEDVEWIRLMYCYPDKITDELIAEIRDNEKVCKYIDVPIQHASDKILKTMNRKSRKADIAFVIEKLRREIPEIAIRTTLITGFPGEKAAEFQELRDFVEDMRFDRLGVFAYSKEEDTPAAEMKPQVRSDVKERRRDLLMQMQQSISLEINKEKIGKIVTVFVEEGPDEDGVYIGRTQQDAREIDNSVIFTTCQNLERGSFVKVKINDAFDYDLSGEAMK